MREMTNNELRALKDTVRAHRTSDMPWTDREIVKAVQVLADADPTATTAELVRLLLITQHAERQEWIDARKGRDMTRDEYVIIRAWMQSMSDENFTL